MTQIQAGDVGRQRARQRPPARRWEFPASAVQQRDAAGAGRGAEACPGSRQQEEEGLGEKKEPGKWSRPTLQQRLLPDASRRRRHFHPRPGASREEPPDRKGGSAETLGGCATTLSRGGGLCPLKAGEGRTLHSSGGGGRAYTAEAPQKTLVRPAPQRNVFTHRSQPIGATGRDRVGGGTP